MTSQVAQREKLVDSSHTIKTMSTKNICPPTPIDKKLTNIFISQDTGSAIKGLTRMDLFLGKGINAEEIAGRLSSKGKIWTLVPK